MARPPLKLCEKDVFSLAEIGCTNEEIGTILDCSADTLERNFAGILKKGRADLDMSLRREQVAKAKSGDNTMLIWLGKNRLDQRDKHEHTGKDGGPIIIKSSRLDESI